jgi:hypothetical protein
LVKLSDLLGPTSVLGARAFEGCQNPPSRPGGVDPLLRSFARQHDPISVGIVAPRGGSGCHVIDDARG